MRARRTRFQPLVLLVAGMFSIALFLPPAAASSGVRVTTIASGLNNPRGIFLVSGSYFVAEAGAGGFRPCQPGPFGKNRGRPTGAGKHGTHRAPAPVLRPPSVAAKERPVA